MQTSSEQQTTTTIVVLTNSGELIPHQISLKTFLMTLPSRYWNPAWGRPLLGSKRKSLHYILQDIIDQTYPNLAKSSKV
jgi:hypothetical protein